MLRVIFLAKRSLKMMNLKVKESWILNQIVMRSKIVLRASTSTFRELKVIKSSWGEEKSKDVSSRMSISPIQNIIEPNDNFEENQFMACKRFFLKYFVPGFLNFFNGVFVREIFEDSSLFFPF